MTKEELFDFLQQNLKIKIKDSSKPGWHGEGDEDAITVTLLLKNPLTQELEIIDSCEHVFW